MLTSKVSAGPESEDDSYPPWLLQGSFSFVFFWRLLLTLKTPRHGLCNMDGWVTVYTSPLGSLLSLGSHICDSHQWKWGFMRSEHLLGKQPALPSHVNITLRLLPPSAESLGEKEWSELAFRYDFRVRLFNLSLKSGKPGVQRTTYRHPYCLPSIILTFNPLCSFNAISGWLCISDKEIVLVVGQRQCHSSECNIHPGRKTSYVVSVTFGHHWHFGTHHQT